MMIKNENFNIEDWNDFNVEGSDDGSTAVELYNSFILFKERISSLPKKELITRGWANKDFEMSSFIDFYRDVHNENGNTLFRKINTADAALSSLWLSHVRSNAKLKTFANSISEFSGISKEELKNIAQLSVKVDNVKELPKILEEFGIVLVYCEALPRMKVDGAVFMLETGHPVVGISFRYPRLDHFWFTLLHELSHLCLHVDRLDDPILDDFDTDAEDEIEVAANRLAKSSFVSRSQWRNCEPKYDKSLKAIEDFANKLNIHKSIVAGFLAHEDGNHAFYSNILNEINIRKVVFGDD